MCSCIFTVTGKEYKLWNKLRCGFTSATYYNGPWGRTEIITSLSHLWRQLAGKWQIGWAHRLCGVRGPRCVAGRLPVGASSGSLKKKKKRLLLSRPWAVSNDSKPPFLHQKLQVWIPPRSIIIRIKQLLCLFKGVIYIPIFTRCLSPWNKRTKNMKFSLKIKSS